MEERNEQTQHIHGSIYCNKNLFRLVLFFSSAEAFLWLQSGHDTGVNEAACSAGYTLGAPVLGGMFSSLVSKASSAGGMRSCVLPKLTCGFMGASRIGCIMNGSRACGADGSYTFVLPLVGC